MSWVAHDVEPYVIQKHLGKRIAFVPLLLGSYAPDMTTKWFVYGAGAFGLELKADNPAQFHRGWPGVGFTHSLTFGVVVALLIYVIWKSRIWALSFLIGQWAHALTDALDTVGTMLFFPFTTHLFSAGAWAYAGQTGRYTDAGAYFSGLGFVWDGVWLFWGVLSWRVLTRAYFRETIVAADPFWQKAGRYLPETALVAIYRISFFYGACRWVAWLIWAHVVRSFAFDLSWGGPKWVDAIRSRTSMPRAASVRRAARPRRSSPYPWRSPSARASGAQLAREQGVHDEVDTAPEPRVVATRAQDPLLREARVLGDLPRGDVLLVRPQLQPFAAALREHPARDEPNGPGAEPAPAGFRSDPVADFGDALIRLDPSHADRAQRSAAVGDREVRLRSVGPAFAADLEVRTRIGLRVGRGDEIEKLGDRTIVAGRRDRLDVALAPQGRSVTTPSESGGSGGRIAIAIRYAAVSGGKFPRGDEGDPMAIIEDVRQQVDLAGHGITPAAASTTTRRRRSCTAIRSNKETAGWRKAGRSWSTPASTRVASSNDKFFVREPESEDRIWWSKVNKDLDEDHFEGLREKVVSRLEARDVYVVDAFAGADPAHRLPVRVITESPWHALFAKTLFIDPTEEELADFEPEALVLHAPPSKPSPQRTERGARPSSSSIPRGPKC